MTFVHACSASLLLHAAMIGVPAGSFSPSSSDDKDIAASHLAVVLHPSPSTAGQARPATAAVALAGTDTPGQAHARALGFGIPAPRYFDARELTRRAKAIGDITPLPPGIVDAGESGRLVLVLRIGSSGLVDEVDVDESTAGDALIAAIADRFRALRFRPAERDGVAVASRMKIEVLLRPGV